MEAVDGHLLALLFFSAIGISFVDAISGGGGLLTIPLLLTIGLGPAEALATNKLQGVLGTGSSTPGLGFERGDERLAAKGL